MHDFKVGDRVRIINPINATNYDRGDIVKVIDSGISGLLIDCGDGKQDFVTPEEVEPVAPDLITIDRADLPNVEVNEAGWVKSASNYLAHVDSADPTTLRSIALQYLSAAEFLGAREKAAEEAKAAEKEAAEKLNKRRDDVARELAKKAGWDAPESAVYSSHLAETQYAIDMLIAEYDRG